jgi:gamma-glutamylcyclotransferase (GGCT)/AIG2-like uncharacterized protein YtfP
VTKTTPQEIFVYGTLLPGQENFQTIAHIVSEWQAARTRGRLFHLDFGYPAMMESDSGWVYGVLLSFKVRVEEALEVCDMVEGYNTEDVVSSLYYRVVKPVEPTEAEPRQAWCYCWARERQEVLSHFGREVTGGDWLAFLGNCT